MASPHSSLLPGVGVSSFLPSGADCSPNDCFVPYGSGVLGSSGERREDREGLYRCFFTTSFFDTGFVNSAFTWYSSEVETGYCPYTSALPQISDHLTPNCKVLKNRTDRNINKQITLYRELWYRSRGDPLSVVPASPRGRDGRVGGRGADITLANKC